MFSLLNLEIKEHVCKGELVNVHENNRQSQRTVWKFVNMLKFKEKSTPDQDCIDE